MPKQIFGNSLHQYHRYLEQAFTLPPHVVLKKAWRKLRHRAGQDMGRLQARWSNTAISDAAFLRALDQRLSTIPGFLSHLSATESPCFLTEAGRRQELVTSIRCISPHAEQLTISAANRACEHLFDLLGSGPTPLGDKIDWHIDFKSGHRFNPRQYYADVRPAPFPGGYDIKVPWELSRCQHFVWLGQAYWFTGDEKYAQEFAAQVEDWISSNPWPWGVNWGCTMDVAIRVLNWLWGYHFFKKFSTLTDEFRLVLYKSLLIHGRHIFRNLENQGTFTSNHYLSNLVGLVYLGILCPEFKEASRWLEFGLRELEKEIFRQVYSDGASFEASTSYHRLVLEMFLSATILARRNGHHFGPAYTNRLEKMVEFVMVLTKPDGTAPLIGDNDNGRLHRLKIWEPPEREWVDFRYLLAIGAVLFQRQDFALAAEDQWEEAIWIYGEEALSFKQEVESRQLPPLQLTSRAFPEAGLYIMRHGDYYMVVDAGSNGQNDNGGHAHNDTLSFELYAAGQTWLLDPGTYVYTVDYRESNIFRSTAYHNTIRVDEQEINRYDEHELFQMQADVHPHVLAWHTTDTFDFIDVEHDGFKSLVSPVTHRRQIYFDKIEHYWIIRDLLMGTERHLLEQYFHFSPVDLNTGSDDPLAVWAEAAQDQKFLLLPLSQDDLSRQTSEAMISPSYGVRTTGPVVCYRKHTDTPSEFIIVLYPRSSRDTQQLSKIQMQQWISLIEQMKSGVLKDRSYGRE
jgi:uncharacterized heparinase superfamily protein